MTAWIDTNSFEPSYDHAPKESGLDIRIADWTRADRMKRQIIQSIEETETPQDCDEYFQSQEAPIDALYLFDPAMSEAICEAHRTHRASLIHGANHFAQTGKPTHGGTVQTSLPSKRNTPLFSIDTNTGGARGPFINYKNRAGQGMPDGSWFMREKDGEDWSYTDMTEVLRGGIVADVYATHDGQLGGSLQMGFVHFPDSGGRETQWFASPMQKEERKDDSRNSDGAFKWQNAVNFRVAIGGGKDALFDITGWSPYKGVMALLDAMNRGFADNIGKAPLFQYTGFRVEGSGKTRLHVPEFVIAKWVDLPECLKADTPTISTQAEPPAPEPAPQPAPQQAAAQASVPAEASF